MIYRTAPRLTLLNRPPSATATHTHSFLIHCFFSCAAKQVTIPLLAPVCGDTVFCHAGFDKCVPHNMNSDATTMYYSACCV